MEAMAVEVKKKVVTRQCGSQFVWALNLGACLLLQGCIEGVKPPSPTKILEIRQSEQLRFLFGDDQICTNFDDPTVSCRQAQTSNVSIPETNPTVQLQLRPFGIEEHEVTNLQYEYCVARKGCTKPKYDNAGDSIEVYYGVERYREHPVVNVTWTQADEYCKFVGRRLPTEAEWELVAGGAVTTLDEKRRFPVARDPNDITKCRNEENRDIAVVFCNEQTQTSPQAVGSSSYDRVAWDSDGGSQTVYDLAGNVREWLADVYLKRVTCAKRFLDTDECRENDECATNFCVEGRCAAIDGCLDCPCMDCSTCSIQANPLCAESCYLEGSCPICPQDAAGGCYRQCRDGGVLGQFPGWPICIPHENDEIVDLSNLGNSLARLRHRDTGDTRALRGGSFITSGSETCRLRSADRLQNDKTNKVSFDLGFRCAADL